MKCPGCGNTRTVTRQLDWNTLEANDACMRCMHHWNTRKLIDPAELLNLISEAKKRPVASMMASIHISSWHSNILTAVESYLTGDPGPLQALAGEKETS